MNAETVNVKFADSLKSWNKGERLEVPLVLSRESREQIALFGLEPFIDQCRQSLEGMLGLRGFQLAPCGGRKAAVLPPGRAGRLCAPFSSGELSLGAGILSGLFRQ